MEISSVEGSCEEWDAFVWASPGGTIFSTLRFLSYHPPARFRLLNLAASEGSELVCVVAGGEARRGGETLFRSPVGASFGGFVFRDLSDLGTMADAIAALNAKLRSMGFDGVEVVLPPACYSLDRNQSLAFLLTQAGYQLISRDATLVVPLEAQDETDPSPALLRNLRKAKAGGVRVRETSDPKGFYQVLVRNLDAKEATPVHSLEDLERLFALLPGRLVLLEAVLGGEVIGGCLVILCNDRVGLAFYICDDFDHRELRPAEAVLHSALCLLRAKGCSHFDLGTVSKGSEINWGLVRFKSKFGTLTYVREHYLLKFAEAP